MVTESAFVLLREIGRPLKVTERSLIPGGNGNRTIASWMGVDDSMCRRMAPLRAYSRRMDSFPPRVLGAEEMDSVSPGEIQSDGMPARK